MREQQNRPHRELLPYAIIKAASKGDTEAIYTVLQYYEGYIAQLSMRPVRDDYGCTHLLVDEVMRHRLEIKLITGILEFQAS